MEAPMPPRIRFLFSTMRVTLAESADRVEIYIRERPLAALLQAGQVRIAEDARSSELRPSEVGLRFNNWDRVRAERLPVVIVSAAGCAVAALMFLLVLTGRLAYRGEKGEVAA